MISFATTYAEVENHAYAIINVKWGIRRMDLINRLGFVMENADVLWLSNDDVDDVLEFESHKIIGKLGDKLVLYNSLDSLSIAIRDTAERQYTSCGTMSLDTISHRLYSDTENIASIVCDTRGGNESTFLIPEEHNWRAALDCYGCLYIFIGYAAERDDDADC